MSNNIHVIKNEDGEETNVNYHYLSEERPVEGQIAYFTVYESVEYWTWGEEGMKIPFWDYEPIYTIPFLFNRDTLGLLIKDQEAKILELMEDKEVFVGVEKSYLHIKDI